MEVKEFLLWAHELGARGQREETGVGTSHTAPNFSFQA